jgi:hypothetical protein
MLLRASADPNHRTYNGETALHLVAISGRNCKKIFTSLFAAGADHGLQNDAGWTPLHLAARYSKLEETEVLLEAGANPMVSDDEGNTVLHMVGDEKTSDDKTVKRIMEVLLNSKAKLDATNDDGRTPLLSLIRTRNVVAVETLLKLAAEGWQFTQLDMEFLVVINRKPEGLDMPSVLTILSRGAKRINQTSKQWDWHQKYMKRLLLLRERVSAKAWNYHPAIDCYSTNDASDDGSWKSDGDDEASEETDISDDSDAEELTDGNPECGCYEGSDSELGESLEERNVDEQCDDGALENEDYDSAKDSGDEEWEEENEDGYEDDEEFEEQEQGWNKR